MERSPQSSKTATTRGNRPRNNVNQTAISATSRRHLCIKLLAKARQADRVEPSCMAELVHAALTGSTALHKLRSFSSSSSDQANRSLAPSAIPYLLCPLSSRQHRELIRHLLIHRSAFSERTPIPCRCSPFPSSAQNQATTAGESSITPVPKAQASSQIVRFCHQRPSRSPRTFQLWERRAKPSTSQSEMQSRPDLQCTTITDLTLQEFGILPASRRSLHHRYR